MKFQLLCALVAANLAFAEPISKKYNECFSQTFIRNLEYCGKHPICEPLWRLRSCMIHDLNGFSDKAPSEEFFNKSWETCLSNVSKTVQDNSRLTPKDKELALQALKEREVQAVSVNKECSKNHS
ncbi:hypothetical protein BDV33DRAFT_208771 [Aspergillus novoparasiticus]|uniref:Extracellular membrane protein CFEM domain-containing protein n=1 Tax=Aspergillus novoparasiticus TaxID=986946 RepID=A0A5N6ECI9_9EURO|nr:hypothetical protein BDV33DRAFT_208771 [Aspergillus novoparasiticus]